MVSTHGPNGVTLISVDQIGNTFNPESVFVVTYPIGDKVNDQHKNAVLCKDCKHSNAGWIARLTKQQYLFKCHLPSNYRHPE